MTLTTKEKENLALMINEHLGRIRRTPGFTCGACHEQKFTQECAGVFPFFPKDRHKNQGYATYVICKSCTKKTPADVYEGVATYLAKSGFFVKA